MHAIFIPYGGKREVDIFVRDMEAQKHIITFRKGKKEKKQIIDGQVRLLPFGVYEYIFPKESMHMVLTVLGFKNKEVGRQKLGWFRMNFLRTLIKCDKIPEYDEAKNYFWDMKNVNIIPIGVRYDAEDFVEPEGEYKGWQHEAL